MEFKILQIRDIKSCEYAFDWWKFAQDKFNINDYQVVYEGEIDGDSSNDTLERLFIMFNVNHPQDFRGHSLSVSDLVELDGELYYCDSVGWEKLSDLL